MRATIIHGKNDVRLEDVPDPQLSDTGSGHDAVVRVVAACVCGSDLWAFRGIEQIEAPRRNGHEWVGVVEEVGKNVTGLVPGDFVIAPMYVCDGSCANCANGVSVSCLGGGTWGSQIHDEGFADAGQGERVHVPFADSTLVVVPGGVPSDELIPSLLTLSDVMCTGHHAAVSGGVGPGATVAVVGDGAVGLCAVLAAKRLGAERIVALSRHETRQRLAEQFGASDIVAERGDEVVSILKDMFGGIGPDVVLECVGTKESMDTALRAVRPGGQIGYVGVPAGGAELNIGAMFGSNVDVAGGLAYVREYIPELLPDVLDGTIEPGKVFDLELPLDDIVEAYKAMDERRAIKVLVRP
jgi:threonine dehydrogenase-like Zn-dependent dehydrogenase